METKLSVWWEIITEEVQIMRQTVEVKVTLTFEAENEINYSIKRNIEHNVMNAIEHWDWNGALCPPQIAGYVISKEVSIE